MESRRDRYKKIFLDKAFKLYGNKYDYSKIEYVDYITRVMIHCNKHDIWFTQAPGKHLSGTSGCKKCKEEKRKITNLRKYGVENVSQSDEIKNRIQLNSLKKYGVKHYNQSKEFKSKSLFKRKNNFIEKARLLYGDKYDYTNVDYKTAKTRVKIYCKKHDIWFEQMPDNHLSGKSGCEMCQNERIKNTNNIKYGVDYPSQNEFIYNKVRQTNLSRYGVECVLSNADVQEQIRSTNVLKYGKEYYFETEEFKQKVKQISLKKYGTTHYVQSDVFKQKSKQTCLKKYGVDKFIKSDCFKEKFKQSVFEKYGVFHPMQSDKIKEKVRRSCINRYGVDSPFKIPGIQDKINKIKRENNSFNASQPEENMYLLLIDMFGKDDVLRQYRDVRYPFNCDFYIKSLDLFIELNANWTHGKHWFDKTNKDDFETLAIWTKKSKISEFYKNAIEIWTERDVLKRNTAKENNLNYKVFWDNDLKDFYDWFDELFFKKYLINQLK